RESVAHTFLKGHKSIAHCIVDMLVSTSMTHSALLPWLACLALTLPAALAQNSSTGRRQYESRCVACHGGDANGGEHGPSIVARIWTHNDESLAKFMRAGRPDAGMPAFALADVPMRDLIRFLR